MVAIATLEGEDARRPSRERESLTAERTRIINRMKAALIRLGIRGFKPELLKTPQHLEQENAFERFAVFPRRRHFRAVSKNVGSGKKDLQ
jgi:hypothetical protein